jgi:hypothetical protein
MFDDCDFLAELTQHMPHKGTQFKRRYGLYASRTRGKWSDNPEIIRQAPDGWIRVQNNLPEDEKMSEESECAISGKPCRQT